jgi:hypothetical protein
MNNELVTGLFFNEPHQSMWIMYTELPPERIDSIDKEGYMELLKQFKQTKGARYDIYYLILCMSRSGHC